MFVKGKIGGGGGGVQKLQHHIQNQQNTGTTSTNDARKKTAQLPKYQTNNNGLKPNATAPSPHALQVTYCNSGPLTQLNLSNQWLLSFICLACFTSQDENVTGKLK